MVEIKFYCYGRCSGVVVLGSDGGDGDGGGGGGGGLQSGVCG